MNLNITNVVELIRDDCVIGHKNQVFGVNDIENFKKFLKNKIYHRFQGKTVNKTVIIWSNNLTVILPAVKAIWELGANVAVHDINVGYTNHPEFKNFYNFLDLIIREPVGYDPFPDKLSIDVGKYDKNISYNDHDCAPNQPVTLDTVAVKTHSSGTTGTPKIIDITHKDAIRIVNNVIKIFNFDHTDRVLHYKTLHHGSLFLNYAIPAFATSSQHWWITNPFKNQREFLTSVLSMIEKEKITKFLIPYNWVRELPSLESVDLSGLSIITVQGPTSSEIEEIFNKFNPLKVINNFGCTEVGTMFISITNKSNLFNYNPNRFDLVIDQLEYQIEPTFLKVRYPDMPWQILADCFVKENNILWWRGRSISITVDNTQIDFSRLTPFLENYYGTIKFSIVPDFEKNKLYLAVYDQKIPIDLAQINSVIADHLGEKYKVSQISYVDPGKINFGMKPSAPLLLYMFRAKY